MRSRAQAELEANTAAAKLPATAANLTRRPAPAEPVALARLAPDDLPGLWQALGPALPASVAALMASMRPASLAASQTGFTLVANCPPHAVAMAERIALGPMGEMATKLLGARTNIELLPDSSLKSPLPAGTPSAAVAPPIDPALLGNPLVQSAIELLGARVMRAEPRDRD